MSSIKKRTITFNPIEPPRNFRLLTFSTSPKVRREEGGVPVGTMLEKRTELGVYDVSHLKYKFFDNSYFNDILFVKK